MKIAGKTDLVQLDTSCYVTAPLEPTIVDGYPLEWNSDGNSAGEGCGGKGLLVTETRVIA